ncbi:MAG: hypothetical protein ACKOC5_16465 [Chloroflexota bacterium]
MYRSRSHGHPAIRRQKVLAAALAVLLAILACSMPTGQDNSARIATDVAIGIQQTQLAQTAAALQTQVSAPSATPQLIADAPTQPSAPTDAPSTDAPATEAPPTEAPPPADTPAPAPTDTPPVSNDTINLTEFKLYQWAGQKSGCIMDATQCWSMRMSGSGAWRGNKPTDGALTYRETVYIDPSWRRPYLVFRHSLVVDAFTAYVQIKMNDAWGPVKVFNKGISGSSLEAIDLSSFKGEEIGIQFYGSLTSFQANSTMRIEWTVQDIRIIPDYSN